MPPGLEEVAGRLSKAQRHFVLMSSEKAMHPYYIDSSRGTAKSMVTRGFAYRTACRMTGSWNGESFNGYGLTPLGVELRAYLLAHKEATDPAAEPQEEAKP